MLETKFTKMIGCTVPIQQSGMGTIASVELAASVSMAGGLGTLSFIGMPSDKIKIAIGRLRKLTSQPFCANFLIPNIEGMEDLGELHDPIRTAAKHAKLVDFFYRDPVPELVKIVHSEGALVAWQIGSKKEASAAVDAGCDLIIAQGIEAGGHVRGRIGLVTLLDQVLSVSDVPVLAAGGVGSGRALATVIAAGASGARIGTRFVAAKESAAHPVYQEALIKAEAEDTIYTDTFSRGWQAPGRVLQSCVEAANRFPGDVVGERFLPDDDQWHPVYKFQPVGVTKEMKGTVEAMSLWAGEGVGNVKKIQPAAEIVKELMSEAEELLKRRR